MDTHTDQELLGAWRTGDQEALAVLVARHHAAVQAACRRQAPAGELDDCVQAVFLVLSRRPGAAARAPVLLAWLLRVACLVCRQASRSRRRRRRAEQAAAASPATREAPHPEALDHLDDCLQRLPAKQRDALCLHYLAGKDPAEVATALGTSRDQAYLLVHRGLAGLRVLLARRGIAVGGAALASLLSGEAAAAGPAPVALVASLTSATPSPGAAALASGAMATMTLAALTPYLAAAGLVLAAGTATFALTGEATPAPLPAPAPVTAPAPPVATRPPVAAEPPVAAAPTQPTPAKAAKIVSWQFFDIQPGQNIRLNGREVVADQTGLSLLAGVLTKLEFRDQADRELSLQVVSVNADTGNMAPAWAFDEPVINPDGSVTAVGFANASLAGLSMARAKALMEARTAAVNAVPSSTTVSTAGISEKAGPGGQTSRVKHRSTQFSGDVSSKTAEYVVAICTDPASLPPPLPPRLGTAPSLANSGFGSERITTYGCWVRITATVQPSKPMTEEQLRRAKEAKDASDALIREFKEKREEKKLKDQPPKP